VKRSPPSAAELAAARDKTVRDVIAPGLSVLFCGINPGLYSAATGHHFARPGNRFYKTLYEADLVSELLSPYRDRELLEHGFGITNLVARTTATASELSRAELVRGRALLERKIRRYHPKLLAVLGVSAYRLAFEQPSARVGLQTHKLAGAALWILPNPSGLNAHYQLSELVRLFSQLRSATAVAST
jgi:double-stranded uracil-DNA glycosylase